MLLIFLLIVLVIAFAGSLPVYPHSREWGYAPGGVVGFLLILVIIWLIFGNHLFRHF